MTIRNYKPGDFPEIVALWKETGIYNVERGDSAEVIHRCNATGGKFLIMEDESNRRIVGTSWLTWDGRRVLMHHFAVLPSLQRKGYGRKLAIESLAFAREKESPMKLEVQRHNFPAIQLYKNLGFKLFEGLEVYIIHHDA